MLHRKKQATAIKGILGTNIVVPYHAFQSGCDGLLFVERFVGILLGASHRLYVGKFTK